jgi:hypothetical protein
MFYFTDEKYNDLLIVVGNPVKKGNEPLRVERIFVILSNEPNTQKKHLANMLLCEWQADLKMKVNLHRVRAWWTEQGSLLRLLQLYKDNFLRRERLCPTDKLKFDA